MKKRFPIYIDIPSFYNIAENRYRNFEYIFKKRALVYLDATDEEIDDFLNIIGNTETSVIGYYYRETDVHLLSGKTEFEDIFSRDKVISNKYSGYVFILDITKEKAHALSEESGVLIITKEEIEKDPDVECLILDEICMKKEDVVPEDQYGVSGNGWIGLLNDRIKKFPPFNEIIVYDNYLSQYSGEYSNVPPYDMKEIDGRRWYYNYIGLENLLLLFNAILPKKHINPMKILIVLPKIKNKEFEQTLVKRIKGWIKEVKRLRTYKFCVSFLLIGNKEWRDDLIESRPVHPRVLYTNYFYIETEKGFKIFKPNPFANIVRKDGGSKNNISIESFFSTPKMLSNPIETNYNQKLKDIGDQLLNISREIDPLNNNIVGDFTSLSSFSLFDEIKFGSEHTTL